MAIGEIVFYSATLAEQAFRPDSPAVSAAIVTNVNHDGSADLTIFHTGEGFVNFRVGVMPGTDVGTYSTTAPVAASAPTAAAAPATESTRTSHRSS